MSTDFEFDANRRSAEEYARNPRMNVAVHIRRERFEGIRAGYEADGPRFDSVHHTHIVERYALVTEKHGCGYLINYAETLQGIERVAAADFIDGWQPVCYYDLDELDGPEPDAEVGDIVQVSGSDEIFTVAMVDYEPGGEPRYIAEDSRWLLHSAADIVERGPDYEEERNPKRYLVAGVRTFVVFNTEPAR